MKKVFTILSPLIAVAPVAIVASCSSNSLVNRSELFKPEAGEFNGLSANKYANILKALDLKPSINLKDLNNQNLTQQIQKTEPQAKVEIVTGSTAKGSLTLKVGDKNDQAATAAQLEITGFQTDIPAMMEYVFKPVEFAPTNPNFNTDIWIENLLPIENHEGVKKIEDTQSITWKKILNENNIEVILHSSKPEEKPSKAETKPIVLTLKELKEKGFDFDIKATRIENTNEVQFNIGSVLNHYLYNPQGGIWTVDSKNKITIAQTEADKAKTSIPNENAAKQYVLDKTKFVDDKLPTFYPSLIKALSEYNSTLETNNDKPFWLPDLIENDLVDAAANAGTSKNRVLDTYFKNKKIQLSIVPNPIIADDYAGVLILQIDLFIDGQEDWSTTFELSSEGTNKKLGDHLEAFRKNPDVWTLKDTSTWKTNILKALKSDNDASSVISGFFSNQTLSKEEVVVSIDQISSDAPEIIYGRPLEEPETKVDEHKTKIQKIKNNFNSLTVFGKELVFEYQSKTPGKPNTNNKKVDLTKTTIDFETGLITFNDNNFQIEALNTDLQAKDQEKGKMKILLSKSTNSKGSPKLKLTIKAKNFISLPPTTEEPQIESFDVTIEAEFDQTAWNGASSQN